MFDFIYRLYRLADSCILYILISYSLYILCDAKHAAVKTWQYLLAGTAVFLCINCSLGFVIQKLFSGSPYWVCIFSLGLSLFLCSYLFLQTSLLYRGTYILFSLTFIQLYKIVCSPLYELEFSMDTHTYARIDFFTGLLFYALLVLLCALFQKVRLTKKLSVVPEKYLLVLYFPLSILFCTMLTANNTSLWLKFAPILAAIIMTNLPIIYYFFTTIIDSYEKQRDLNNALQQTKAQLSHYRYAILLQDEIRKERHELRNNYFYIQTLLAEKKYDALDAYMQDVIGSKLSSIGEVQTGNTLMDYILNEKIREARKKKLKLCTEILIPANLKLSEDSLCTILLNLLDNAIEASLGEDNPDIRVFIRCTQGYLTIRVKNRISFDVLAENPALASTQKNKSQHGFGIKIIRNTVREQNGILNFDSEGGYFSATVMLPCKFS